jgi:hypothetical protein
MELVVPAGMESRVCFRESSNPGKCLIEALTGNYAKTTLIRKA